MSKALICNDDETTTGGHVIATIASFFDGGRRVALDHEMATCGNCPGEYPIQASGTGMIEKGRATVLDNDLVLCPCGQNHVKARSDAGCSIAG
jgi:hypothetical protein